MAEYPAGANAEGPEDPQPQRNDSLDSGTSSLVLVSDASEGHPVLPSEEHGENHHVQSDNNFPGSNLQSSVVNTALSGHGSPRPARRYANRRSTMQASASTSRGQVVDRFRQSRRSANLQDEITETPRPPATAAPTSGDDDSGVGASADLSNDQPPQQEQHEETHRQQRRGTFKLFRRPFFQRTKKGD